MQKKPFVFFLVSLLIGHSEFLRSQETQTSPLMMFREGEKIPSTQNQTEEEEQRRADDATSEEDVEETTASQNTASTSARNSIPTRTELDDHFRENYQTLQTLNVLKGQQQEISAGASALHFSNTRSQRQSLKAKLANDSIEAARTAWNQANAADLDSIRIPSGIFGYEYHCYALNNCSAPKIAWRKTADAYQQAIELAQTAMLDEGTTEELNSLFKKASAYAANWTAKTRYHEVKKLELKKGVYNNFLPNKITPAWTKAIQAYNEALLKAEEAGIKSVSGRDIEMERELEKKQKDLLLPKQEAYLKNSSGEQRATTSDTTQDRLETTLLPTSQSKKSPCSSCIIL